MSDLLPQQTQTESGNVFVRFGGWVYELPIRDDGETGMSQDGIVAICRPNGLADIKKYDLRSGVKIFDGLGSWCSTRPIEQEPDTVKIKIRRKTRVQNCETFGWRILDETITVYATCDEENGEYRFRRDGKEYSVAYEDADAV